MIQHNNYAQDFNTETLQYVHVTMYRYYRRVDTQNFMLLHCNAQLKMDCTGSSTYLIQKSKVR